MDGPTLFAGVLFGAIGIAAWRIGRRRDSARHMLLGAALVIYPWLIPDGVWVWVVGALLTALVFLP